MAQPILCAFADEYASSLTEQLEGLNRFGIRYLELRHADGKNVADMTHSDVAEVQRKLHDAGIKVNSIGSPLGKIALDGDLRAHMERTKRVCETAASLDAKYVRMFSFYLPAGSTREECKEKVIDALGRMLDIADSYSVIMCHENEAKIWGESPGQCRELLDAFGGRLRAVFDMGNFVLGGYEPYKGYELLGDDVAYFHIKDALARGAIVPAGMGEAKIKEILSDYKTRAKNDFFISLEPHLETFAGLNALTDVTFENPYKYADQKTAFADAVAKINQVLKEI